MAPQSLPLQAAPVAAQPTAQGTPEVGVVQWFHQEKGFGIIEATDASPIFVSYDAIVTEGFRCLRDGQHVTFVRSRDDRGPVATQVRLAG